MTKFQFDELISKAKKNCSIVRYLKFKWDSGRTFTGIDLVFNDYGFGSDALPCILVFDDEENEEYEINKFTCHLFDIVGDFSCV